MGRMIKKIMLFGLGAIVLFALLKVFNYDPFGIIDWAWNGISGVVDKGSDWLSEQSWFNKVTDN